MEYAYPILQQIGIMFLIILVGYILFKLKIITTDGRKQLSELMLTIVCPALVFMVYQTDVTEEIMKGLLWSFLLSGISIVIGIIAARTFISGKINDFSVARLSVVYTNCAFMGIPLIEGIFGSEGVLYITAYITMFNLFVWSHGVVVMSEEKSLKSFLKVLRSPTIIAVILGLLCFTFKIKIPEIPATALNYIKSLNTPVAMLIAGATMAQSDMGKAIRCRRVIWPVLVKLFVLPVIVIFIFKLLPVPGQIIFTTNVIASACPTATIITMFALRHNKNAVYASEIFAITTLLSAVSLPLVTMLSNFVYNLV